MRTRRPVVADRFYPGDPEELRDMVGQYVEQADVQAAPERVVALVAPHAGYIYSGSTAGFAYARVRGKAAKRVILLGCSHRYHISRVSVYDIGTFETPVGAFPVDEAFAKELAGSLNSEPRDSHLAEHSIEVQLPFLAMAVGQTSIVPVLFGNVSGWHVEVGEKLAQLAEPDDLLIASTDLSHYLSQEHAHQTDRRTLDTLLTKDPAALVDGLERGRCAMCGGAAVVAAMAFALARGAEAWSVLDYRTSAEVSGDYAQVVGYAAVSMENAE